MENYEFQSDFARKYIARGREEGREEARDEARAQLRRTASTLAQAKLELYSSEDVRLIQSISDEHVLVQLILGLGRARDTGEARLALDQLIAPR